MDDGAARCRLPTQLRCMGSLFRQLPLAYRICRVYTQTTEHDAALGEALDRLISPDSVDDKTNM